MGGLVTNRHVSAHLCLSCGTFSLGYLLWVAMLLLLPCKLLLLGLLKRWCTPSCKRASSTLTTLAVQFAVNVTVQGVSWAKTRTGVRLTASIAVPTCENLFTSTLGVAALLLLPGRLLLVGLLERFTC